MPGKAEYSLQHCLKDFLIDVLLLSTFTLISASSFSVKPPTGESSAVTRGMSCSALSISDKMSSICLTSGRAQIFVS